MGIVGVIIVVFATLFVLVLLAFTTYLDDRVLFKSDIHLSVCKGFIKWLSSGGVPEKFRKSRR